ncbi:MAG: lipopolysaccharide heptosyltransferase II [Pyrinomonadaceae bacterium]
MRAENIERVVVRGTNWVGDAVMSVPALRELRRVLPNAHITLCTRGWAEGIFADADFIDQILTYDKKGNSINSVFKQAKKWRGYKFDLAILLNNAFESALLAQIGGAQQRIGYRIDGRGFLLTDALSIPAWKDKRHEVFYYLNIIAQLEIKLFGETRVWERDPDILINVSESRKNAARKFLAESGVDLTRKIIALCPGSTNSRAKRWQTESYSKLADLLQENLNASVVLIGSPDELEVSNDVCEKSTTKPILLTGKTSLSEAVAALSVVNLLVTNDTGPAHIAPAVGTKTIVIFGPTTPETTRPFSDLAEIIVKPPGCAPCMLRDCPIDHRCMTAIKPFEIFKMIEQSIN